MFWMIIQQNIPVILLTSEKYLIFLICIKSAMSYTNT